EGHGRGLVARAIAQGAAGVADLISDGMEAFPSMGLLKLGTSGLPSVRDTTSAALNRAGVAQPQTSGERVGVGVGEALTGTALTMGAGAAGNVRFLKANPVQQAIGATTGSAAAGIVK